MSYSENSSAIDLGRYFFLSMFFHGLIGVILFIGTLIMQSQSKDEKIILVKSSVQVDVVEMPTMTLKQLKRARLVNVDQKSYKDLPNTKQFLKLDKKKAKKEKKKFLNMLKNLGKQEEKAKLKKSAKTTDGPRANTRLRKLVLAGNKLQKGALNFGQDEIVGDEQAHEYLNNLPGHVRPQWKLPSYLQDLDLKCRIKIFLGRNGKLIKTKVFESSGNKNFDARAIKAVELSAPFPPLPKGLEKMGRNGRIVLGFPL